MERQRHLKGRKKYDFLAFLTDVKILISLIYLIKTVTLKRSCNVSFSNGMDYGGLWVSVSEIFTLRNARIAVKLL